MRLYLCFGCMTILALLVVISQGDTVTDYARCQGQTAYAQARPVTWPDLERLPVRWPQ
jgi:hypothetical protein